MITVANLQHIDNTLHVNGAEFVHEGLHILILHSLCSFTGLYSSILNGPGGLLSILLVFGLFNVSNLCKLAIQINSHLFTCSLSLDLSNSNLLTL
jgi:hypothetical protein